ncbi:MAG: DUF4347 domain-containing protein [Magnetococcales bacterium]|nr:DUF4347 domain-containing protein [Magnetococcales bacterium]
MQIKRMIINIKDIDSTTNITETKAATPWCGVLLQPHLLALEPRLMFDAAAGAEIVASSVDATPDEITAQLQPYLTPPATLQAAQPLQETSQLEVNNDIFLNETDLLLAQLSQPELREIVFIDSSVDDINALIQGIAPNQQVVLLDGDRDGIEQIGRFLSEYGDFDAIHIVSHGGSGQVTLGNSVLSNDSIPEYSTTLKSWGQALTVDGDILFYGCDVASGESGASFVSQLATLTGADIAASIDVTGALAKGGDWDLEIKSGTVEAEAAFDGTTQRDYAFLLASDPAISIDNTSLAYTQSATATQVDSAGTLTDADGDSSWNSGGFGKLVIQITGNFEAKDQLSITDNVVTSTTGTINTDGTNLRDDTVIFGTLSASEGTVTGNTALTITFNANATNDRVQDALQAIHFYTSSSTANDRTVTFTAEDKTNRTASDTRTITVTSSGIPSVSSVTSTTTDGSYTTGDAINVTVTFDEPVTVTGTPQITMETGTTDRVVDYVSGSGTSALVFTYTVQASDTSSDLDYASTSALALNGGTIKDATGNSATLTLASPGAANSLGNASAIVVDTTPTVTLSIDNSNIAEAGGTATVTATLSGISSSAVTVNLAYSGTATSTTDYTTSATSITIAAGSTTGTATITGVDETTDDDNETIIIDISSVTNATESGTQQVTATITDDDSSVVVATVTETVVTTVETTENIETVETVETVEKTETIETVEAIETIKTVETAQQASDTSQSGKAVANTDKTTSKAEILKAIKDGNLDPEAKRENLLALTKLQKEANTLLYGNALKELEKLGNAFQTADNNTITKTPEWFPELTSKNIAILIGIDQYSLPMSNLNTPINDISAISEQLSNRGFQTISLPNATQKEIIQAFHALAAKTTENHNLIIYYAGHGYQNDKTGTGYWLPSDAMANSANKWLSTRDLSDFLAGIPANHTMLISDSCFSGSLTKEYTFTADSDGLSTKEIEERRSVMVLSSGGEEPVMDGGGDGHSVFARNLISTLQDTTSEKTGFEMFINVRKEVVKESPQIPQYGAMISAGHEKGGDFIFKAR